MYLYQFIADEHIFEGSRRRWWLSSPVAEEELVYRESFPVSWPHGYTWSHEGRRRQPPLHLISHQISFGNRWSVSHIALSPTLRRCCRNAELWSGSILFSTGAQTGWVWKVRIPHPSGPFLAGRGTRYRRVLDTRRSWGSRQCEKATWGTGVFLGICLV